MEFLIRLSLFVFSLLLSTIILAIPYVIFEERWSKSRLVGMKEGRGLWSILTTTTTTTPTPDSTSTTSVEIAYVHYDAYGNNNYNLNDEYIVIKNVGDTSVNLEGWILKDEAGHTFVFPSITLDPRETVTI